MIGDHMQPSVSALSKSIQGVPPPPSPRATLLALTLLSLVPTAQGTGLALGQGYSNGSRIPPSDKGLTALAWSQAVFGTRQDRL